MQATAEADIKHRAISVAEYYRMADTGIIGPDERVELLDGDVIVMPPIGPEHGYFVDTFHAVLQRRFDGRAAVRAQGALRLDDYSEPQPDITLLVAPRKRYHRAQPTAADTLLLVEVAQSSLTYDGDRKLRAYARRGIPEYWIMDVAQDVIEVFRSPFRGRYRSHLTLRRGDTIAPLAFPDDVLDVDELLKPAETAD